VDIVRRVALAYDDDAMGSRWTEGPVPDGLVDRIEGLRSELVESAVEHDDELLEKYLGGEELTEEEIRRAIRQATIAGGIVPVLCGSAFKNKGVQQLLDAVIDYLPSPLDIPPVKGHVPHKDDTVVE